MQLEYNYNLQLVCNLSTATKNQQLQRARFSSSAINKFSFKEEVHAVTK